MEDKTLGAISKSLFSVAFGAFAALMVWAAVYFAKTGFGFIKTIVKMWKN